MTDVVKRAINPEPAVPSWLLEKAINNLSMGLVIFDKQRKVVFCNKRYMEIYGLSAEQVKPGTPLNELIQRRLAMGQKAPSNSDAYIQERFRDGAVQTATVQEFSDGRTIIFTVYPMPDGGGMATHEDITEREDVNARLAQQHELLRQQEENLRIRHFQFDTAINNMSQGLCFFDAAHRLIVCNDRYVDMYDLPRDRVGPGTPLTEIVDMRFNAGSFPAMSRDEYLNWRTNVAVSNEPTDSIVELKNGRTFKIRHRPMPDGGWVATHEDITEQRRSEVKIEYMAHHDALTDLANRVLLNERLEHALGSRIHREQMVAVHHLDLDQFKAVNDTFGHHAGDLVLQQVAAKFSARVRRSDTVSRTGGDEFSVILEEPTNREEAENVGASLRQLLELPVTLEDCLVEIGASVGIAIFPEDAADAESLCIAADRRMYEAKQDKRRSNRDAPPARWRSISQEESSINE